MYVRLLILGVSLAWSLSSCMQALRKDPIFHQGDSVILQYELQDAVKSIEIPPMTFIP